MKSVEYEVYEPCFHEIQLIENIVNVIIDFGNDSVIYLSGRPLNLKNGDQSTFIININLSSFKFLTFYEVYIGVVQWVKIAASAVEKNNKDRKVKLMICIIKDKIQCVDVVQDDCVEI